MKALLIDVGANVIPWVASLLIRAGFTVDVVTTIPNFNPRCDVNKNVYATKPHELLKIIVGRLNQDYDLIVPCSDTTLKIILDAPLDESIKIKILPVATPLDQKHLCSKIGLSEVLSSHKILTPDFKVATCIDEMIEVSKRFDFPFLVKNDYSYGGAGVFCIRSSSELYACIKKLLFPVILQRKISGRLLDLSGFFQNKELIYFSYSEMLRSRPTQFSPSVVRRYYNAPVKASFLASQLTSLGDALGANGFSNISAIESFGTGDLYFIEADMRPNIWVQHSKFIGEDPALRIRDFFLFGKRFNYHLNSIILNGRQVISRIIPHVDRLSPDEIEKNYLDCKSYLLD